jgi:thiosulfate/3-mercaptopyruvate sulfurtransferase
MSLPLLLEPEQLLPRLDDKQLLIIDTSSAQHYRSAHIAGAIHLPPGRLQCGIKPATGKLPDQAALSQLFSEIGLTPQKHVVAVDDEGGGWAGRLIWTLDCIGHQHYSLLNGGMVTWINEDYPVEQSSVKPEPSSYAVTTIHQHAIASVEDIVARLHDAQQAIWDARSPEEYEGSKILAQRGGHIPGAANLEWTELMDPSRNLRLLPLPQLTAMLEQHGLTPDKSIITHCHSHHRSGLTYVVAKLLGYPQIKAYDGSWGEWGNRDDTPIEQGQAQLPQP